MLIWHRSSAGQPPMKKYPKLLGESLEDYYALIEQLHGLTVGSFESALELDDKPEAQITHYPDDGSNDPYIRFES